MQQLEIECYDISDGRVLSIVSLPMRGPETSVLSATTGLTDIILLELVQQFWALSCLSLNRCTLLMEGALRQMIKPQTSPPWSAL
jgi:hypothetical protein